MFGVVCSVNKGYDRSAGHLPNLIDLFCLLLQLLRIAPLEFRPFLDVVGVPLAKLGTRGDVFQPRVDLGIGLLDAAGPKSLDQHPLPVFVGRRFVRSFKPYQRKVPPIS